MFELGVALKYLVPRKKSLSTALISAMSVWVISLVVWLVLVFLSVTAGIEKTWVQKLTSLHAPLRLSPTDAYYQSYFYQIDALSAASSYSYKTIGEKREAPFSDPYAASVDPEIPPSWPQPLKQGNEFIDPVKGAFGILSDLKKETPGLAFQDYEIAGALMRLTIHATSSLSQMSYLLSIPEENPRFSHILIPPINLEATPIAFEKDPPSPPPYAYLVKGKLHLPSLKTHYPVLVPKNYRENGVTLGDRGTLNYTTPNAGSSQEQKLPIQVVGFYDPGVMAVGGKCLLVPREVTRTILNAHQTFSPDGTPTNGIFIWTDQVDQVKETLKKKLEHGQIASFWKVTSYEEYEFAKDLLQQFRSDRTLLLLVAVIILIVACSNIISLLVLLVNDKKREIAVLQSMGASFKSIAAIFGLCGIGLGVLSSVLGTLLAAFTLHHIDRLVSFLSAIQGRAAFHPAFFGGSLPNELSREALLFIVIATPLLSLAAGLIPALKASRIHPSSILRSE